MKNMHHVWLPYTQMQTVDPALEVVSAEGVYLFLKNGKRLIDGISSWWTQAHGYNHPYIRQAMHDQLEILPHVMLGGLVHENVLKLAKRLAQITPGDLNHVFFSESGSISVEVGLKMALQYWFNQGIYSKRRFIAFKGGYHGDSFATMSICDPEEGMHRLFSGVLRQEIIVDLPQTEEEKDSFLHLLHQQKDDIAAVIVEPLVQGAGGMRFHSPQTLSFIAENCKKQHILLILDEIMTGFGRTGTLFACEQAHVCPDIMTLSKALTGGFCPLAATVATKEVFQGFLDKNPEKALMHGPTYTGHALGCAAANASLDLFMQEDRIEQIKNIETHLKAELECAARFPCVKDVRVKGAIGVIECYDLKNSEQVKAMFLEKGVWVRPLGNVIYLMPAFIISEKALSQLTQAVIETVRAL